MGLQHPLRALDEVSPLAMVDASAKTESSHDSHRQGLLNYTLPSLYITETLRARSRDARPAHRNLILRPLPPVVDTNAISNGWLRRGERADRWRAGPIRKSQRHTTSAATAHERHRVASTRKTPTIAGGRRHAAFSWTTAGPIPTDNPYGPYHERASPLSRSDTRDAFSAADGATRHGPRAPRSV
jgi:hypothetical protein